MRNLVFFYVICCFKIFCKRCVGGSKNKWNLVFNTFLLVLVLKEGFPHFGVFSGFEDEEKWGKRCWRLVWTSFDVFKALRFTSSSWRLWPQLEKLLKIQVVPLWCRRSLHVSAIWSVLSFIRERYKSKKRATFVVLKLLPWSFLPWCYLLLFVSQRSKSFFFGKIWWLLL